MSLEDAPMTAIVTEGTGMRHTDVLRTAFVELRYPNGNLSLRVGPFTPERAEHLREQAMASPEPIRLLSQAERREHPRREADLEEPYRAPGSTQVARLTFRRG